MDFGVDSIKNYCYRCKKAKIVIHKMKLPVRRYYHFKWMIIEDKMNGNLQK